MKQIKIIKFFFTYDYCFAVVFVLSFMMDTVNFCCFVFILHVVISIINHKHNCHKNRNVSSQTFHSKI